MTYRQKSRAVIGRCHLFEISRPQNDIVTIKLIEVYEVNWFLYDPGDPSYQNWVLSINMMMMHIFHYWITRKGKHVNMSGNGGDEFSLWQWISATSLISMVTFTLLDFSSCSFSYIVCVDANVMKEAVDVFLSAESWPVGVLVRRYFAEYSGTRC